MQLGHPQVMDLFLQVLLSSLHCLLLHNRVLLAHLTVSSSQAVALVPQYYRRDHHRARLFPGLALGEVVPSWEVAVRLGEEVVPLWEVMVLVGMAGVLHLVLQTQ